MFQYKEWTVDHRRSVLALALFGTFFLTYGLFFLSVSPHWLGFLIDEGWTRYGAQRILEGELPHRDFFFFWTTGILWVHALGQKIGLGWWGERVISLLFATLTSTVLFYFSGEMGIKKRGLFALGLVTMGFSLWNYPYASWDAIGLASVCILLGPSRSLACGVALALSTLFKQNVGIFSFLALLLFYLVQKKLAEAFRLSFSFITLIFLFYSCLFWVGGSEFLWTALRQNFLFPLTYRKSMGFQLPANAFSSPLMLLGLWIISLYLLKGNVRSRISLILQLSVLSFLVYLLVIDLHDFRLAIFSILSIGAWLLFPLLWWDQNQNRTWLAFFWVLGMGAFAQIYPRLDFQHLLFFFPFSFLALFLLTEFLMKRYPSLSPNWLRVPLLLWILLALILQSEIWDARFRQEKNFYGQYPSRREADFYDEMVATSFFLRDQGLKEGRPLLVIPHGTSFYSWNHWKNPTPHNQFFPAYVEAQGKLEADVLSEFIAEGGSFLVVEKNSRYREYTPIIAAQIEARFTKLIEFPAHFSVWKKKP